MRWRWFGTGAPMMRSREEGMAAADAALPGYAATDAVVSADGRVALAIDADGRLVVVTAGRRWRARGIAWAMLRQTYEGIAVETGDRRFGTLMLLEVDALDMRRLGHPDWRPEEPAPTWRPMGQAVAT